MPCSIGYTATRRLKTSGGANFLWLERIGYSGPARLLLERREVVAEQPSGGVECVGPRGVANGDVIAGIQNDLVMQSARLRRYRGIAWRRSPSGWPGWCWITWHVRGPGAETAMGRYRSCARRSTSWFARDNCCRGAFLRRVCWWRHCWTEGPRVTWVKPRSGSRAVTIARLLPAALIDNGFGDRRETNALWCNNIQRRLAYLPCSGNALPVSLVESLNDPRDEHRGQQDGQQHPRANARTQRECPQHIRF